MAKFNDVTIGQVEACINLMGGIKNFRRYLRGQGKVVFDKVLTLLKRVPVEAQVTVTTSVEYFRDAFVMINDGVPCYEHFVGLDVPATAEMQLAVHELEEESDHARILAELGDKAEISVSQFKAFLRGRVKINKAGTYRYLTYDYDSSFGGHSHFLFHLRGKDGQLVPVMTYWCTDPGHDCYHPIIQKDDGKYGAGWIVVSRS